MIKILCENEDIKRDVFEFIRLHFPSYENNNENLKILIVEGKDLELYINFRNIHEKIILKKMQENRLNKIMIKQKLYILLFDYFELHDSWGILTGVKPIKLTLKLMEKNSEIEVRNILKNIYYLLDDAIDLCLDIAKIQYKYIYPLDRNRYNLYVHIPFCPSKCSYCSFLTLNDDKNTVEKYTENLIEELKVNSEFIKNPPRSIYIGGGTPTVLNEDELFKVVNTINNYYGKSLEFTVECGRPDTIDFNTLQMLKENAVDRISINPQTMNEDTLVKIGRKHSVEDILDTYEMAKKLKFNAINMDLILGLPDEGQKEVINSLKIINALNPENITIHTLALKNGSKLYKDDFNNKNNMNEILEISKTMTMENNYNPYYMYRQKRMLGNGENIGYSKKGLESIYNIAMMEEKESILGAGMCSSSKFFYPETNKLKKVMQYRNINDYFSKNIEIIRKKEKYFNDFEF